MEALQREERYTYADYCQWDDDTRWELIDGVPYAMAPGPTEAHQDVAGEFFVQFKDYLKGKPCKVIIAPFDVRLNPDGRDDTVVQPDIIVVCDKTKLDGKCCRGAPDFALEVLSPSNSSRDKVLKFNKYRDSGVREYWLVDPVDKTVQVCVFDNGGGVAAYGEEDEAPVRILPGCVIKLKDVFAGI